VDSLWLQAVEPKEEGKANREIKEICMQTEEESMLSIGFSPEKDWYKFISFLPTKEFEGIGALNRYWGVKKDNEIKVRGIDIRRRDVPRIVKEYQREVMQIFSECSNEEEFMKTLRGKVKRKTLQYFALMDSGNVSPDRLAVTIRVTRPADGYKVNNYQAVASKQLEINGISVRPGQSVKYIITDANNPDATQRVIVEELYSKRSIKYDVEKYKELIFRALKNLIHTTIPDDFTRQDSSIKGLDRFLDADVNR